MALKLKTRDIVSRIRQITGWNQQEVGTNIYNKSKQLISDQLRRNKIDWPKTIDWAVRENIDLNWLILGQGTPNSPSIEPLETQSEILSDPVSTYKSKHHSDIPADELAMAIDLKLQSVTAHMDILHAAIARLRRKNDQLMKILQDNLSKSEIKKLQARMLIEDRSRRHI